ncbi:MAG TPA: sigma-70 family RNA polymerase sigma factor [Solirubrobacteraceae bacterium]|nr:sigma-70 family RNA polymerase sigma factor [Solirubrobacteraceae bacterium]
MSPRLSPSELFLRAQTDERLAALAAEGHGRAFAVLIERHRRPLMGHARRLVGPERDEDVVQQALLRAWRALERGAEVRHVQAWLHRIVHNTALTEIERQMPAAEPLDDALIDPRSADVAAEQRLAVREVLAGVSTLPERQRLALLGTELEGRSRRQLAAELGLSEGAIRQLVYRARDGVRSALAAFVPLPLVTRVMRASGWLPGTGTGASSALRPVGETAAASGLATGAIVKAGTVVLAIGAVGGLVLHDAHGHHHARHAGAHRTTVSRAARSAARPPLRGRQLMVTAMRTAPAGPGVAATTHAAVAVAPHAAVPAAAAAPGPAPATPQPQTSISSQRTDRTGGSGSGSGDSSRPSHGGSGGDSSSRGSAPTRSAAGTGGDTGSSSSGDKQSSSSSGDGTGSSGGGQASTAPGTSSSSTDTASAASTSGAPDSTSTSGQSDSSGAQPPASGSSSTGTTTSPSGGD